MLMLTNLGHDLAVADGGHGDDHVPEAVGYADKVGARMIDLGEVDARGEENDADDEKANEEHELVEGGLERVAEYLQALEVTRQLEDAEDADEANDAQYGELGRGGRVACLHEVGHNGKKVDDVAHLLDKLDLVGRRVEAHHQLDAEPHNAHRLDHEELVAQRVQRRLDGVRR